MLEPGQEEWPSDFGCLVSDGTASRSWCVFFSSAERQESWCALGRCTCIHSRSNSRTLSHPRLQGPNVPRGHQLDGTAEKETALRDGGQPASPQYCRDIELQSKVKQGAEGMKQDRAGKQSSQALFEEAH